DPRVAGAGARADGARPGRCPGAARCSTWNIAARRDATRGRGRPGARHPVAAGRRPPSPAPRPHPGPHGHEPEGRGRQDDHDGEPGGRARSPRHAGARARPRPAGQLLDSPRGGAPPGHAVVVRRARRRCGARRPRDVEPGVRQPARRPRDDRPGRRRDRAGQRRGPGEPATTCRARPSRGGPAARSHQRHWCRRRRGAGGPARLRARGLPTLARPAHPQRARRRGRAGAADPDRVLRAGGCRPARRDRRARPHQPQPGAARLDGAADDVRRPDAAVRRGGRRGAVLLRRQGPAYRHPALGPGLGGPQLRPERAHLRPDLPRRPLLPGGGAGDRDARSPGM
ncbi:MAG: Chromosome (plasmid) partitioning protein ParA, partial [uncultured Nocardioidaceae bacterium]